jgi:hypothetical protein
MNSRRRCRVGLVSIALLATHGIAGAQPRAPAPPPASSTPPPPSSLVPPLAESLSGAAKESYESGKQLFGFADFTGALIKFQAAYDVARDPRLLFNMATCESKLHHYAKSLVLMQRYLKDSGALLSDQDKAEATAAVAAFTPLTSTLTVTSEPGATVTLDDQVLGTTPLDPQTVDIGVHKLRVSKPEFHDFTSDLTVSGGTAVAVPATLAPVVHEGKVVVRAPDKAAIYIDDVAMGVGQFSGSLKSGGHTLRVTAQGMLPFQYEVLVQDDQTRDIPVSLQPQPWKVPVWAWVAGGVVVAGGLGVAAYFIFKPGPAQYTGATGTLAPGTVQASVPLHLVSF